MHPLGYLFTHSPRLCAIPTTENGVCLLYTGLPRVGFRPVCTVLYSLGWGKSPFQRGQFPCPRWERRGRRGVGTHWIDIKVGMLTSSCQLFRLNPCLRSLNICLLIWFWQANVRVVSGRCFSLIANCFHNVRINVSTIRKQSKLVRNTEKDSEYEKFIKQKIQERSQYIQCDLTTDGVQ